MNRKKICFVTTLPLTIRCFLIPQTERLIKQGWDVTCVCSEDLDIRQELPREVHYVALPFRRGIDSLGVVKAIYMLYKLFRRERFSIVQYSTPNAAFYASTASWMARTPVRLYAQWGIRYVGFTGIKRKFFKSLETWCCRRSTIIEPDSLSNLEFSIEEGLYTRQKGRVIWNGSASGVNLKQFDINKKNRWREVYRAKIELQAHHVVVGFVGSIRGDKGGNELIAACLSFFGRTPDARLVLVGDQGFYHTIQKDLRDWVASSNQVILVPANREIPQYLACMDIFALPSYREGFGLVIVEAEAMGVPVVVSDVPGPSDAMLDNETGFVVPVKDTVALAKAIESLIRDPDKRAVFGSAAEELARQNFEQKKFLDHVLQDKMRLITDCENKQR